MNSLHSHFHSLREYLSPVLRNSKFKETGCLTPEEFVAAGDFLVFKFPTWSWEKGEPSKVRSLLPEDKQYLVTRNVPCLRRVKQMEYTDEDEDAETRVRLGELDLAAGTDEDDWVATHQGREANTIGDIADTIDDAEINNVADKAVSKMSGLRIDDEGQLAPDNIDDIPDMDEIPDIEDESEVVEEEDEATLQPSSDAESKILQVRTYDVHITYDKYYQVPRMWLMGYDPAGIPLTSAQVYQDVSQDHAKKTLTIEPHPHLGLSMASIHPCKHASVMKKIIERMGTGEKEAALNNASGPGKGKKSSLWKSAKKVASGSAPTSPKPDQQDDDTGGLRVDQYLVIFLKFMSSVVPTIDYDATGSV